MTCLDLASPDKIARLGRRFKEAGRPAYHSRGSLGVFNLKPISLPTAFLSFCLLFSVIDIIALYYLSALVDIRQFRAPTGCQLKLKLEQFLLLIIAPGG